MNIKTVGQGAQAVYVYYYPSYQQHADAYYWPCKIGMTKKNVIKRVYDQVKTGLPEAPEIGLIIKCEDAYLLEQALHAILKLKHRELTAPGTEWFNTTPEEVLTLAQAIRAY